MRRAASQAASAEGARSSRVIEMPHAAIACLLSASDSVARGEACSFFSVSFCAPVMAGAAALAPGVVIEEASQPPRELLRRIEQREVRGLQPVERAFFGPGAGPEVDDV